MQFKEVPKPYSFGCQLFVDTEEDHPEIVSDLTGLEASEVLVKYSQAFSPVTNQPIKGRVNQNNLWIYNTNRFEAES